MRSHPQGQLRVARRFLPSRQDILPNTQWLARAFLHHGWGGRNCEIPRKDANLVMIQRDENWTFKFRNRVSARSKRVGRLQRTSGSDPTCEPGSGACTRVSCVVFDILMCRLVRLWCETLRGKRLRYVQSVHIYEMCRAFGSPRAEENETIKNEREGDPCIYIEGHAHLSQKSTSGEDEYRQVGVTADRSKNVEKRRKKLCKNERKMQGRYTNPREVPKKERTEYEKEAPSIHTRLIPSALHRLPFQIQETPRPRDASPVQLLLRHDRRAQRHHVRGRAV